MMMLMLEMMLMMMMRMTKFIQKTRVFEDVNVIALGKRKRWCQLIASIVVTFKCKNTLIEKSKNKNAKIQIQMCRMNLQ